MTSTVLVTGITGSGVCWLAACCQLWAFSLSLFSRCALGRGLPCSVLLSQRFVRGRGFTVPCSPLSPRVDAATSTFALLF